MPDPVVTEGLALPVYAPSSGALVTAQTYSQYEEDAAFKGVMLDAPANQTSIHDLKITTQIYVEGGYFWSDGGNKGDYVEVSVVDKDDVLGLFATFNLTVGVDVLELDKFVETMYLKPGGMEFSLVQTSDIAQVMAGLYIRTKYENVGAVAGTVSVLYKWFESGA